MSEEAEEYKTQRIPNEDQGVGTERQEGMGLAKVAKKGELATTAAGAMAKAAIEAPYVMAKHSPRNMDEARATILQACKRPAFAQAAWYRKPIGKEQDPGSGEWSQKFAEGTSIRFVEMAIQAMGNIIVTHSVSYEDEETLVIETAVTDLERNLHYKKPVSIKKIVERSYLKKGAVLVYERQNTNGKKTFGVRATEDEMLNKQASQESKSMRTLAVRLIPADILEDAKKIIEKTSHDANAKDPEAAKKAVLDGFMSLNVRPAELEEYVGHPIASCSPKELVNLRAIYQTIKDGDATWATYIENKIEEGKTPERGKVPNMKPGVPPPPKGEKKTDPAPVPEKKEEQKPEETAKEAEGTEPELFKQEGDKAEFQKKELTTLCAEAEKTVNLSKLYNLITEAKSILGDGPFDAVLNSGRIPGSPLTLDLILDQVQIKSCKPAFLRLILAECRDAVGGG